MLGALFGRRKPALSQAERFAVATQLQLTWWRFKRHKVAMISLVVVVLFYLVALGADFLATTDPHATDARTSYIGPQPIHFFENDGSFSPHVYGLKGVRDPRTFKLIYTVDPSRHVSIDFFAPGYEYTFLGISTTTHLFALRNPERGDGIFILGTDQLGRDAIG